MGRKPFTTHLRNQVGARDPAQRGRLYLADDCLWDAVKRTHQQRRDAQDLPHTDLLEAAIAGVEIALAGELRHVGQYFMDNDDYP